MTPEDIARLRDALACSVGELAVTLGVEVKTVLDWESGERFPTKRHADHMAALKAAGPSAIARKRKRKDLPAGLSLLAEPRFWSIIRKLHAHPEFVAEVERLAGKFKDPAEG